MNLGIIVSIFLILILVTLASGMWIGFGLTIAG